MFVIPCKYNDEFPFVVELVKQIRNFHPSEKIVVVDSNSDDVSYSSQLKPLNVDFMEIQNKNWMIGAYWSAYKRYPNEDFYYFMHDSMKIKGSLEYLKKNELTVICYFDRTISNFNSWGEKISAELGLTYTYEGKGCYGPIFFCKNEVMRNLSRLGVDSLLPNSKAETGFLEGAYGFFFEYLGYDLTECSLYGDVLQNESRWGKSGVYPHDTSWQFPVEKFYASHLDPGRSWEHINMRAQPRWLMKASQIFKKSCED